MTFDPQAGHEQKGRRPALVVSNDLFKKRTGLAIVCPITNTRRDFPFHVAVADDPTLTGFIMVEQVRSVDFRARRARRIARTSDAVMDEVLSLLDLVSTDFSPPPPQYSTLTKKSPCGGAVGPAARRLAPRRTSPGQVSARRPRPTSTSVPTMVRTML